MKRGVFVMVGCLGAACGGSGASPPIDGADVDGPAPDSSPPIDAAIDAPVDAFGCPPVVPTTPARVPRALAVRSRGAVQVFAQRSDGFRSIYTSSSLGDPFNAVAWGDANGDGIDELAHSSFNAGMQVIGDRGAGLTVLQTLPGTLYAVDWLRGNGDTYDDVWRGDSSYDSVLCGATGAMSSCWTMVVPAQTTRKIASGDGDNDGDEDVAVHSSIDLRIYRNVGGQYALALQVQEDVQDLAWVELDGCGGDDLVAIAGSFGTYTWKAWHWTGTAYEPITPFTVATPPGNRAFWSDFDGDGDADPLMCSGNQLRLYRRAGGDLSLEWSQPIYSCQAAWGDYDADGDDDLAYVAADGENNALVLLRNDAGTLTEVTRTPPTNDNSALAWGRCGPAANSPCFPLDMP